MAEKEVVVLERQASDNAWGAWTPDIVVGIDFGMTYTGMSRTAVESYFYFDFDVVRFSSVLPL
jgi:hypothetical protein